VALINTLKTIFTLLILSWSLPNNAQHWQLQTDQSSVNFVSIKHGKTGETHTFSDVLGTIENGHVAISIKPDSVDTGGITEEVTINALITQTNDDTLLATSHKPVIIKASKFNLVAGIQKLSSLVNDIPISLTVPVNFTLLFKQQTTQEIDSKQP